MNIYAEYFSENGINYRKTTIIQIGDSWEIIGSAILKNPGSAIPLDDEIEKDFYCWKKGTYRFDIWHWFDEKLPHGIVEYAI